MAAALSMAENPPSRRQQQNSPWTHYGAACAQAFVYNPEQLVGAARTTAVKSFGSAGTSSSRMAKQFPALSGYGIAQVLGAQALGCAVKYGNVRVCMAEKLAALSGFGAGSAMHASSTCML